MLIAWKEMGFFDLSEKEELAIGLKTELTWVRRVFFSSFPPTPRLKLTTLHSDITRVG